jgi:hypothetical protein
MHTFFHGWRPKAGCIMLVMACLVTAMWVRSYLVEEALDISGADWTFETVSQLGSVSWKLLPNLDEKYRPWYHWKRRMTTEEGCLLHHCGGQYPYVVFITPLTFFSAYLILWNPRKRA